MQYSKSVSGPTNKIFSDKFQFNQVDGIKHGGVFFFVLVYVLLDVKWTERARQTNPSPDASLNIGVLVVSYYSKTP